jgi:hypothetical protein
MEDARTSKTLRGPLSLPFRRSPGTLHYHSYEGLGLHRLKNIRYEHDGGLLPTILDAALGAARWVLYRPYNP